jgi:hypothetical protein
MISRKAPISSRESNGLDCLGAGTSLWVGMVSLGSTRRVRLEGRSGVGGLEWDRWELFRAVLDDVTRGIWKEATVADRRVGPAY